MATLPIFKLSQRWRALAESRVLILWGPKPKTQSSQSLARAHTKKKDKKFFFTWNQNKFLCVKLKRAESVKTERKKFVKFRVRVSVILQKLKFDFLRQIVWKNVNKSLRNKVEEFNHKNFQKWYLEFWQVFRAAKNCVLKNFWTSKIAGILDLQISKSENLSLENFELPKCQKFWFFHF